MPRLQRYLVAVPWFAAMAIGAASLWLPLGGGPAAGLGDAALVLLGLAAGMTIAPRLRKAAPHGKQSGPDEPFPRSAEDPTAELEQLWSLSRDAFVITDSRSIWLSASPAWTRMLGWTEDELLGRTSVWLEHPEDQARTTAQRGRLRAGDNPGRFVNRYRAKDGSYHWLSWNSVAQGDRFYHVARDITDEREQAQALKETQEALLQSQKLESIGHITGGVAHDFNNLLTPIIATLDLLLRRELGDARTARMLTTALEAAERARVLVQRLLAFARRQPLRAGAVDVGALVERLRELIASTLGPQIQIEMHAPVGMPPALADANQLELALLNLAVNARDAMPDGGRFELAVGEESVEEDGGGEAASARLRPGRYLRIRVSDDGVGMPPEVLGRAVEPFFSTKGLGRGTGLGLSMVHGLMAQLGGGMQIRSAPGQGATVLLWLPLAEAVEVTEPAPPADVEPIEPDSLRVLLVDDEPLVREATAQMLSDLGYAVLEADSASAALDIVNRDPAVRALVTDQLMPGMSGEDLTRQVRARRPDIALLVVSGYAGPGEPASDLPRLSKPFRSNELAQALADARERVGGPASPAA